MSLSHSSSTTFLKKKPSRGCFSGFRTAIRSLLPRHSSSPSTKPFASTAPATATAATAASSTLTPAAGAAAPVSARRNAAAAAAEALSDSDLDDEPIPSFILRNSFSPRRPLVHPLNRLVLPLPDPAAAASTGLPVLRGSPEVPEDPAPAAGAAAAADEDAASMLSDCECDPGCQCHDTDFWTDILIDKSHVPISPGVDAPIETQLMIKDTRLPSNRTPSPVALDIHAIGTQLSLEFRRPPTQTGQTPRQVTLTADMDDYDTIRIEWNRECVYDLMELSEEVRVKCKFAADAHFITLRNPVIYA